MEARELTGTKRGRTKGLHTQPVLFFRLHCHYNLVDIEHP